MQFKKLKLTQGKFALVDIEDYAILIQWKWRFSGGYAWRRNFNEDGLPQNISMHRQLSNFPRDKQIDHINGNRLDNRRANLRICTHTQNCWNKNISCVPKTSKFKGVYWEANRKKWRAYLYKDNKRINLGRYNREIEAAIAYNNKASKEYGEFARLNEVLC